MSKTKGKILKTALKLFSTYGYDNVGINLILDEVGVKKPTLYHYFGSKKGLFEAILKEYYNKLFSELKKTVLTPDDIIFTLEKIAKVFFQFAKENTVFCKLYLALMVSAEESETRKINTFYFDKIYNFIEKYFKSIAENRDNLKDKVRQMTFSFIGTINTYLIQFCFYNENLNDEMIFRVVKQYMYGIFSL